MVCDYGGAGWHDPVQREFQPACGTIWQLPFLPDFTSSPGTYQGHCEDVTVSVKALW